MKLPPRNQSWRIGLMLCLALVQLHQASNAAGQAPNTNNARGWQTVADRPGLTQEERDGARFASQHLPIELFNALSKSYQKTLLRYAADHEDGEPALVLCWEKNTPAAIVKPFLEIEYAGRVVKRARKLSQKDMIGLAFQADESDHWATTASNGSGQSAQGLPVTLTWSIVPDGTTIPGGAVAGEGLNEPSNLRAWLAGIYGGNASDPVTNQSWFPLFEMFFADVAAKTGIRYVYEPNDDGATLSSSSSGRGLLGIRGDIRISGHAIDGNYNVLAYDYFPDFSDMVIDTSDVWFNNTSNNSRGLRNVLEHEHGHGLGLAHVCPIDNTKLMEPFINVGFTGIQFDDIYTLQRLYGDFLEVHGSVRNNDSFATATPVSVSVGVPYVAEWLGIDDDTDVDYISFNASAGTQLTARAVPSNMNYLEGEQNSSTGSCTAGTPFDSSIQQNLELTVYDSQMNVVGSATSLPAGLAEEVASVVIDTGGTYHLRISGSGANLNQLYRLELELGAPSYAIQLTSANIVEELWGTTNGVPDPGETVRLEVVLENVGQETATNLQATLTGPSGLQAFDVVQSYGDLAGGNSLNAQFTFALNGQCGDQFDLPLNLSVNGEAAGVLSVQLGLGVETIFFQEDFDGSSALPSGWGNTETGRGRLWSVVGTPSIPGRNSAFADDYRRSGQSLLTTPTIALGAAPGSLRFTHYYDTEAGFDGGVLEIQVGGGGWQDIISAGGVFLSGGYNDFLENSSNPIDNRNAWSGDSGEFITTEVAMPPAAANQTIQLRWNFGHDNSGTVDGWYLEDIDLSQLGCQTGLPTLSLSSSDTSLSEYYQATDPAIVTVSAGLPVTSNLFITLNPTGSANALLDLNGFQNITLVAGNASTSLVLTAISDGLVEGDESLSITSPDASGTVQITILDTPYGQFASTNLGLVGAVHPFDDFDLDGSPNIEELVFGSDLKSAASLPEIHLEANGADYQLPALLSTLPDGVFVEGESSIDLQNWSTNDVSVLPGGFRIPGRDPQRYLRLHYTILEAAP